MENYHICNNCGEKNALHAINCISCRAYLRERIVNIDLGSFIFRLIEEPFNTMRKAIYAEHKNYSIFFFILLTIKIFALSFVARNFLPFQKFDFNHFWVYFLNISAYFIGLFVAWSFIVHRVQKLFKLTERLTDQFATFIYAATPVIIGFAILLPVELALYGTYWFTFNPSPFFIKGGAAYVLYGIEGVLLLWSLFLFFVQFHIRTKKIIYSVIAAVFTFTLFYVLPVLVPVFSFE